MVLPLWAVITIAAAALQTLRNALQRRLTGRLTATGANYTRFAFGLPFALLWLAALAAAGETPVPTSPEFWAWCAAGGVAQILGTQALIKLFQLRDFATGVVFSKTEIVLVALFGLVALGDPLTWPVALAIGLATSAVMLLAAKDGAGGVSPRSVALGLASGACYGVAAVAFRGAILSLDAGFLVASAQALAATLAIQTALMTAWLRIADPAQLRLVFRSWRASALPGLSGAAASAAWFAAFAIEPAAHVRMLGLIEVLITFAIGAAWFRERPSLREAAGAALLVAALALLLSQAA